MQSMRGDLIIFLFMEKSSSTFEKINFLNLYHSINFDSRDVISWALAHKVEIISEQILWTVYHLAMKRGRLIGMVMCNILGK